MKKLNLLPLTFLSIFVLSCGNYIQNEANEHPLDSISNCAWIDSIPMKGMNYHFYPEVSIVAGTIGVEMFYGAPNYGESPETEEKEYCFILYPDTLINVINTSNEEDFDATSYGVKKIQIAFSNTVLKKSLKGKKVLVTGTFYGKENGHHQTNVLLNASEIVEAK